MFECLVCEDCGKIYPLDYDGLKCECGGWLHPTRIFFPEEGETLDNKDPPIIAS